MRLPEQDREACSKQYPRIQGHEGVNSNKAFMTELTQQLDQDVIEVNSVSIQLYPHGATSRNPVRHETLASRPMH